MSLDANDVKTIAFLARIRVPDEQLPDLAKELSAILGWVEQLDAIDTGDVAPMTSVIASRAPARGDRVADGGDRGAILANAPEATEAFFAVPKVVE